MFKLKSLFRRGQGSSHNSNSNDRGAKHSSSNNNRNKSQSTTSLNSQTTNETVSEQHITSTVPTSNETLGSAATNFYTPAGGTAEAVSERAVDVGDDYYQQQKYSTTPKTTKKQQQQQQNSTTNSNTLNQKKTKFKGQKQPKQIPQQPSLEQQLHNSHQLQQPAINENNNLSSGSITRGNIPESNLAPIHADTNPSKLLPANVMTSIALSPGTQNSSVPKASAPPKTSPQLLLSSSGTTTAAFAAAAVANNNYPLQTLDSSSLQHQQHQHQHQLHTSHPLQHNQNVQLDSNDLYKLNTAIAAAAVASNYHHHHQQQQQQHQQFLNSAEQQQKNQQLHQHQQQLIEANTKMQELQTKLDRLGHEKNLLETRITELLPYQNEAIHLKAELVKMQNQQERNQIEISNLKYENETLRNRLRDVVNSPLSDAEKHQIIQDSQRLHSSAPASIALPNLPDHVDNMFCSSANVGNISINSSGGNGGGGGGSTTPCLTPEWDKHSSSSEISVACLQDKIIQMEETHYSTNEELQATLQELADLQSQLSDAQAENERLTEEKDVLFQTLCSQTEKLTDSRNQITTLQELLLRDAKQAEIGNSERENKLLDLIKTSQEEREATLIKQEELNSEVQDLRQSLETASQDNMRYRERVNILESTIETTNAERKQIDIDLQQTKDEISQRDIEINRLTTLLENARSKIDELEQDLSRGEKTDLSDLLDAARKEKDCLEERVAELQDQVSRSQAEIRRLREQLSSLNEESLLEKNNAKCTVSHLEFRLEQIQSEKDKLQAEYQELMENTAELQVQCKCHLEDKTQLQSLLNETQKHLEDVEAKLHETENQLEKEIKLRKQEAEEWNQFQSDLLMTVRVANDFKTEALSEREQLVIDNKTQKEKIRMLEQQIEKLTKQNVQQSETQQSVLTSVQQEMASRRNKIGSFNRQDSRLSVKTLIESIENNKQQQQQNKTDDSLGIESRYSSSSSLTCTTPEITNIAVVSPSNNLTTTTTTSMNSWPDNQHIHLSSSASTTTTSHNMNHNNNNINTKGPLRDQQQQQNQQTSPLVSSLHHIGSNTSMNLLTKSFLGGERKDPLNMLVKNGGSKRNALLKWCQNKTVGYRNIDITNFSSSWNDGLAFCAILHSYLPDLIPYDTLTPANKRRNFSLAFAAAESVGIPTTLNINDMCQIERPDWTQVMSYVTAIYKHFET